MIIISTVSAMVSKSKRDAELKAKKLKAQANKSTAKSSKSKAANSDGEVQDKQS